MNLRQTAFLLSLHLSLNLFSIAHAEPRAPTLELDGGVGIRSNYGIVGAGFRVFPSNKIDLHANVGLGLSGVVSGVGARVYFLHSETPFLFIIPASNAFSIGFTVLNTSGGEATIGDDVSKYKTTNGRYLNVHIEHNSWLWNHIALPIEIGYAFVVRKPSYEFAEGVPDEEFEKDFDTYAKSGFLFSIGLGVAF